MKPIEGDRLWMVPYTAAQLKAVRARFSHHADNRFHKIILNTQTATMKTFSYLLLFGLIFITLIDQRHQIICELGA